MTLKEWNEHLRKVREENPSLSYKDAQKKASETYPKSTNREEASTETEENQKTSFLKYLGRGIVNHRYKIGTGLAIGLLGALAFYKSIVNKEVYRGEIDGWKVSYNERNGLNFDPIGDENWMTLVKGNQGYGFYDEKNPTRLESEAQKVSNIGSDKLERVVYVNGIGEEEFYIDEIEDGTIKGANAKEIFEKANTLYSSTREKIRAELRKEKQKRFDKIKEGL